MKKLLYQFDTDTLPSVFDNVVGYDGGADHISAYGGVNAENVGGLWKAPSLRAHQGQEKYRPVRGRLQHASRRSGFRRDSREVLREFRVSVMFDCNGSNTTAAAAVAWLTHGRELTGKRAVVLAGSGPVGQRAAVMLAREGAIVAVTGRRRAGIQAACDAIKARFGIDVEALRPRATPLERRPSGARTSCSRPAPLE